LKLAFPNADVPIVQVSCRSDLDFEAHYRLGKALSSLKNLNIWIIGSGAATHNLREIM
jgi:4,5-DOPA dioxygenase extradiol